MNSVDGTKTLGSFLQVHTFSHTKMILLTNNVPIPRQGRERKSSAERDESDRKEFQENNLCGPSAPLSFRSSDQRVVMPLFFRLNVVNAVIFPVKRR